MLLSSLLSEAIMASVSVSRQGSTIFTCGKKVYINNVGYTKPGRGNTIVQSNGRIFINGYEFKNGKFKRNLRAIFECIF